MIESRSENTIITTLSALFSYGLNNRYSYNSIEEYIANSFFVNELENCRFISPEIGTLCKEVYHLENEVASIDVDIAWKINHQHAFILFVLPKFLFPH